MKGNPSLPTIEVIPGGISPMSDGVVELQKVTQNLAIAHNAWQGSFFLKVFAAKLMPQLSPEESKARLMVLRMTGQLVDTEFERAMDELVTAWKAYREATNG